MTASADRLTKHAKKPKPADPSPPAFDANAVRPLIDALERLGYALPPLFAAAGIRRSELADPDYRMPCELVGAMFAGAMRERPIENLAARLAAEIPIGAFPLIDYLVVTSETVGDGLKQLAR